MIPKAGIVLVRVLGEGNNEVSVDISRSFITRL
jgi:hypothetical protein